MEVSAGLAADWLVDQQQPDGSWGATDATSHARTTEAVLALRSMSLRDAAYYAGLSWLENRAVRNLDDRARRILALAAHGNSLDADAIHLEQAQRLLVTQNGGWGLSARYAGSPIDSALTLRALAEVPHSAFIQPSLDSLKDAQLSSPAGWSAVPGGAADPVATARVLRALALYAGYDSSLASVLASGAGALENMVDGSSSPVHQALAILALRAAAPASPAIPTLESALESNQLANGSWDDDPYATALGLQALAAAIGADDPSQALAVAFPDFELRRAINLQLGRNAGDTIRRGEMARLTSLIAQNSGISDLTGLEFAANLTLLNVSGNQVSDLSPLANLDDLEQVDLRHNDVSDLSDLLGNPSLTTVQVAGNDLPPAQDTDGDGLPDVVELGTGVWEWTQLTGTNPVNADTDGDGFDDLVDGYPHDPLYEDADADDSGIFLDLTRSQEPFGSERWIGLDDFILLWNSMDLSEGDPGFHPDADLNGDGAVNSGDTFILLFLWNWEPTPIP